MHAWRNPSDPDPQMPPPDSDEPEDRLPVEDDQEVQRAPGAGQEDPDSQQPPMQASARESEQQRRPPQSDEPSNPATENVLDAPGIAREPVGNDNIREGRVGGVMGPAHGSHGQGQGG
jgi:hypothetical protein